MHGAFLPTRGVCLAIVSNHFAHVRVRDLLGHINPESIRRSGEEDHCARRELEEAR